MKLYKEQVERIM